MLGLVLAFGSVLPSPLSDALPRLEAARPADCRPLAARVAPRLRVDAACRIRVLVVAAGDARALEARIVDGGGLITRRRGDPPTLQVLAPPGLLRALAADPEVAAVRLPQDARPIGRPQPRPDR